MSRGLYTLTSGMLTQQKKIEISSNNIANINTAGYKKEQAVTTNFGSLLINKLQQNGVYETGCEVECAGSCERVGNQYCEERILQALCVSNTVWIAFFSNASPMV